jgi:hypothetical protein
MQDREKSSPLHNIFRMLPTKYQFIVKTVSEEKMFLEINQSRTRMACGGHVY